MKSSAKTIGANIRILRTEQNMTQDALAEALFVTRQTVSNYETGRSNPDVETLLRIAEILNTEINTLIYGKQPTPDRAADRKRLLKAVGITAGLLVFCLLLSHLLRLLEMKYYFLYAPRDMCRLVLNPLLWGSVGWLAVELVHYFFGIRSIKPDAATTGRRILWGFLVFYIVMFLPQFLFHGYCTVQILLNGSVAAELDLGPVYNKLMMYLSIFFRKYPVAFTPFGCAFRLFRKEPKMEIAPKDS